jgi:hypothetical protein
LSGDTSADQKIYRIVNRIEDPVELRWPAHDDSRHVAPEGDADKKDGEQGQDDLQPSLSGHWHSSESE